VKTIVVAADGSAGSRAALAQAIRLASQLGAAIVCVSVDDSLATIAVDPEPSHVAEAAARSAREHGLQAEAVTRTGRAAERILEVADEHDADLIVAGTHGRGLLAGALLGSVSMSLVRHSRRPVMIVQAEPA
jgi:nucleotide-binding universal stress UspA family protein